MVWPKVVGAGVNVNTYCMGRLALYHLFGPDLLLQFQYGAYQGFRARRATLYIYVDGYYTVDTFYHMVTVLPIRATAVGARAHGNNIFRFGHLFVQAFDAFGHLKSNRPGYDDHVSLAGRWARENAETVEIVSGR